MRTSGEPAMDRFWYIYLLVKIWLLQKVFFIALDLFLSLREVQRLEIIAVIYMYVTRVVSCLLQQGL